MPLEVSDLSIPAKGTVIDERAWEEFFKTFAAKCEYFEMIKYKNTKGEEKYAITYGLHNRPPLSLREVLILQLKKENLM